ncbi:hypothetical protein QO010_000614 [Caulobacter ginsengisoli]|uniref:Uncharacterized protein n=1 Tax=Caulobacter ginsengisoli TaxID=400775 RepID=A0ABU0ILH5_9CAUL|nr:hypothetical protein [Caulobacter ginsengisoli]MDQ0462866.1 hypothetical protein [Caulobacter ginsengisoli]
MRLHFAGDFRADVSTVNNDPLHFNNARFKRPNDQLPGPGTTNGWWQPEGTGAWRLSNCRITGCASSDTSGKPDPVVGMDLRDAGDRVSAKLVDLDSEQQLVSTIYGLKMRICDGQGAVLMQGDFEPTGIWDIWGRAQKSGGDVGASCTYQSVLTHVIWGDISGSQALKDLRAASLPDRLSVKFMVDGYAMVGARRGYGRLVGTIGPSLAGEPDHFVTGRHLGPTGQTFDNVIAWLDRKGGKVWVDFGGAIQTTISGGPLANTGDLRLVASGAGGAAIDLGALAPYTAAGFYEATAAIQAFPPDRRLGVAELAAVEGAPLAIVAGPIAAGASFAGLSPLAVEPADGLFCRPDDFVLRMEPTVSQTARIQVSRFGAPIAGQTIVTAVTGNGIGGGPGTPDVAVPLKAVKPKAAKPTDKDGWADIVIAATDPNNPRGYIDGQLYALEVRVKGAASAGTDFDASCFISILLFNAVKPVDKPLWPDVLPIFMQYANLYPRPHGPDRYVPFAAKPPLHPVVNLGDYDAVAGYAKRIHDALLLPLEHPNHMPVVRDLSDGKRALLLKFLDRVMAGENVRGPPVKPFAPKAMAAAEAGPPSQDGFDPGLGGKTTALGRINRAPAKPAKKP